MQKNNDFLIFFVKKFGQFKKKQYLCTRFRKKAESNCGNSSVGRARPCQGRGRGFESRFPLRFFQNPVQNGGSAFLFDRLIKMPEWRNW